MVRVAGILLLGGASRRYGRPKALARHGGRTFLELVYAALSMVSEEVFASYSDRTPGEVVSLARALGATPVGDADLPCHGPLRGVASVALSLSLARGFEGFYIAAVDHPLIDAYTLKRLRMKALILGGNAATPLPLRGYPMVSLGFLDASSLRAAVNSCITRGRLARLTDIYRGASRSLYIGWRLLAPNPEPFLNVNRPEELKAVTARPILEWISHDGLHFTRALKCLEEGDTGCAATEYAAEAEEFFSEGLTLLARHALEDAQALQGGKDWQR